jgi:GT2 family glycosyltransferase
MKAVILAGMFMLFRSEVFRRLGGFDERYFMYYEDADLCARLRRLGHDVRRVPSSRVVHHARRTRHWIPRYLLWQLASMLRFLWSRAVGRN